jgi:hypothetical protein
LNNPRWRRMKAYFTAAPAQSTPRLFLRCRAPPSPSPARASAGVGGWFGASGGSGVSRSPPEYSAQIAYFGFSQ